MDKPTRSSWRRRAMQLAVMLLVAGSPLMAATRTWAMPPNPSPDGSVPGGALMGTVLGWLKWLALAAAIAGVLIGGISVAVGHFGSNYGAASVGRKWLLGGMGSAVIAGLAWTIVNTLYTSTG